MLSAAASRQFVSYPKSGRSWLRFVLARLGCDETVNFHHDGFEFNDGSRPPHNFDLGCRRLRYSQASKVVYLDRDPRDVMVSLFFQVTGRFDDFFAFRESISEFIRDEYFGAINLARFRKMWAMLLSERNYLTVSYEDCHSDFPKVIKNVLSYYEMDVPEESLRTSAREGDFNHMKAVEASCSFDKPWLQLRNGSPKVRKGEVGGFRAVLSKEDVQFLNATFDLC